MLCGSWLIKPEVARAAKPHECFPYHDWLAAVGSQACSRCESWSLINAIICIRGRDPALPHIGMTIVMLKYRPAASSKHEVAGFSLKRKRKKK